MAEITLELDFKAEKGTVEEKIGPDTIRWVLRGNQYISRITIPGDLQKELWQRMIIDIHNIVEVFPLDTVDLEITGCTRANQEVEITLVFEGSIGWAKLCTEQLLHNLERRLGVQLNWDGINTLLQPDAEEGKPWLPGKVISPVLVPA